MPMPWTRWDRRQKRLMLVLVPVAVAFAWYNLPMILGGRDDVAPAADPGDVSRLRSQIRDRQIEIAQREAGRAALREQAAPLWRIEGTNPKQEVVAEFSKIFKRAQVRGHRADNPQQTKVLNLDEVYEIEFRVQVSGPMRVIARFLEEVEAAEHTFLWSQCTIRPENTRNPENVRLTGQIRVLVLSARAGRSLDGGEES